MTRHSPALDLESDLNPQQREAVTHGGGPQLVLAGAGSGKTRVITHRVAWLIHDRGVDPAAIVAVTFTNKAAAEMRERIVGLAGLPRLDCFVGTFHRFSLMLLRRWGARVGLNPDFVIFDGDDQIRLVKKALEKEELSETAFPPRVMLSAISSAKNRLLDTAAYEARAEGFFEQRVARVYRAYQGMLSQASGVDFDDMLALAVRLLQGDREIRTRLRQRVEHLLVDEFQDTNHAQLQLVLELAGADGNITAVGDEDQGIYRWRGADLSNVLEFERSFPGATVRKLERNYRSTQNILTAAGSLVAKNTSRRGKTLWTDSGEGEKIEVYKARDERDEARWVVSTLTGLKGRHGLSDMGVLVRTNAQTRALEDELLKQNVPYVLVGGVRFYERAEIKDLVAYLRVLRNPRDNFSLLRILNQPPRGIGPATEGMLVEASGEEGMTLWDYLLHDSLGGFPTRARNALTAFRELITGLQDDVELLALPELLERLVKETGYAAMYDKEDDPEAQGRLENIREFLSAAQDFAERRDEAEGLEALTAFLDQISLVSDLDDWEGEGGVSLMTLHSAKGLEFPVVVVTGLEEGLLPHFNASDSREEVEEERRLLYVGMTRARERLFLTTCSRRRVAGRYQDREESRFLAEIPAEPLEITRSPELFDGGGGRGGDVRSFFGGRRSSWLDRGTGRSSGSPTGGGSPRPASRRPPVEDMDEGELSAGTKVRHATLGRGVILARDGSGPGAKLTVFFDRGGKRKLVARYAKLEVL